MRSRLAATSGGTVVTVTGLGFSGAISVTFGGIAGYNLTVLNDNQLLVTAPPQAAGTVHVRVTTGLGTSLTSNADLYTYVGFVSGPIVTGISPISGPTSGGTLVTITGSNLVGLLNVSFGSLAELILAVFVLMRGRSDVVQAQITGSIMGVGAAQNVKAVRWGVAGGIVWAWVLTIPCSAFVAALAWWAGRHLF